MNSKTFCEEIAGPRGQEAVRSKLSGGGPQSTRRAVLLRDGRADTIGIALSAWEDAPMPSVRSSIPGRSGPCGRPRPRTHRPILSPLTRTVKLGCSLTSTVHCRRYPLYRWLCHFAIFPSCAPGGSHDGPLSYRDREFPCYMRHKVRAY